MQFETGKNLYITELQESHDVIKKLFFTEIKVDIVYCLLPKAIVLNFYYMEFQIFQKFQYLIYIQNLQISSLFLLKELIDEMLNLKLGKKIYTSHPFV